MRRREERKLHRAQLMNARLRGLRRRRNRRRAGHAGILAVAGGLAILLTGSGVAGPGDAATTRGSRLAPMEELWVSGAIHLVDAFGHEIAVLGKEQPTGPTVLGLYAAADGRVAEEQTLRLATSDSGSAFSVRSQDGDSSVTVLAGTRGPEMELNQGSRRRVITHLSAPGAGVPSVAAGPRRESDVDLSLAGLQDIGNGFMVSGLEAIEDEGLLYVTGRVVNTTSVKHRRLHFRMSMGSQSEEFEIGLISPGNSTRFEVVLPASQLVGSRHARIDYLGSTISYFGHPLRRIDGVLNGGS